MSELHEFLFDKNGELKRGAKDIPKIKEYIENAPETRSTFKLRDVPGVDPSSVLNEHVELIGSWEYSNRVHTGRERVFVNPEHPHSHRFPSLVHECECGAIVSRATQNSKDVLRFENEHRDSCRSFNRLALRAELTKECYEEVIRLAKLGWSTKEMAPKLACSSSNLKMRIREWDIDIQSLKDVFRRRAGNSYEYIIHELGYSSDFASSLLNVRSKSSLRKWNRELRAN